MKVFLKYFVIAFIIFVVICTGIFSAFDTVIEKTVEKVGGIQIFGESTSSLMDDMPVLYEENSEFFEAFEGAERVNVLLLGVNDGLTDTIMVLSFDLNSQKIALISVPRDTYYYREGYSGASYFKINAAYEKDPLNSAIAVSKTLQGMPIHYYAVLDYEGVAAIVDSMGGVPMDIPFHMKYKDPTDNPPLYIDIPEGYQVLDGEHAVQFLRYRKGYKNGDLGRVEAQQEFMKSAFNQMLGLDLPKVIKTVVKNVDSDITLDMALKVAGKASDLTSENLTTYMMPNDPLNEAPWYVYANTEGITEMLREIYSIEPEAPEEPSEAQPDEGDSSEGN
ncbi:MAG: LytR family transcriptional regulator [Clostridiales bacterium]|nr:LytR family transcriptional regulator [Clostridiales bacterium]